MNSRPWLRGAYKEKADIIKSSASGRVLHTAVMIISPLVAAAGGGSRSAPDGRSQRNFWERKFIWAVSGTSSSQFIFLFFKMI
jgi:hypothetical protein